MLYRLIMFLYLAAALTGCSTTTMQNPSVMDAGEVRLAASATVGPYPNVKTDARVSLGIAGGLEATASGSGPSLMLSDKFELRQISAGLGYGTKVAHKSALKFNAEWIQEDIIKGGILDSSATNETDKNTLSMNLLFSTMEKSKLGAYIGFQVNVAKYNEMKTYCSKDTPYKDVSPCMESDLRLELKDYYTTTTGLVLGGQVWLVEDHLALQGEVIMRYRIGAESLIFSENTDEDASTQASIGLVGHFNLF